MTIRCYIVEWCRRLREFRVLVFDKQSVVGGETECSRVCGGINKLTFAVECCDITNARM